jgi:hypothetical protein
MTIGCVETTYDAVFDKTNGSQNEQVDLDLVDDEESTCDALQKMTIGNIRPQDLSNQPQQSQRSSAQLVGAPERQLEVSDSIPQWDEFWASLKKIPSLCLIHSWVSVPVRHPSIGALAEWQFTWPVSDGRTGFGGFLDRDQLVS